MKRLRMCIGSASTTSYVIIAFLNSTLKTNEGLGLSVLSFMTPSVLECEINVIKFDQRNRIKSLTMSSGLFEVHSAYFFPFQIAIHWND